MDDGNRRGVIARLILGAFRKKYDRDRIVVIKDLSLDIEDDEFITVVDPSGYGKSTTLRVVAGLEPPSGGTIRIGGEGVTDQHTCKCNVAIVFQNYAPYPHKTITQNMAFGLRMSTGLSKDECRERARETAAMMGIGDLLDNKPDELSGGQKQQAALGRAIIREPDVLLLDEPFSNLNAKLHTTMRIEIQRLQNELGITSLHIMHDQEEVMTMGDKIVILNDEKPRQVDHPKDIYENPADKFIGNFIGSPSMNFLNISAEHEGDRPVLVGDSPFSYRLFESSSATLREVTDVIDLRVGVRPEDIVTASSGENVVDSAVGVVESIGSDNYLYLDIGPDLIARIDSDVEPETGETVGITSDESDPHVFHPWIGESLLSHESGRRAVPTQQT